MEYLESNMSIFDFKATKTGNPVDGIVNFMSANTITSLTQDLTNFEVDSIYSNSAFSQLVKSRKVKAATREFNISASTTFEFNEAFDVDFNIEL